MQHKAPKTKVDADMDETAATVHGTTEHSDNAADANPAFTQSSPRKQRKPTPKARTEANRHLYRVKGGKAARVGEKEPISADEGQQARRKGTLQVRKEDVNKQTKEYLTEGRSLGHKRVGMVRAHPRAHALDLIREHRKQQVT